MRDFPALRDATVSAFVIDGPDVYAKLIGAGRVLLLHDDGTGYRPQPSAKFELGPVRPVFDLRNGLAWISRSVAGSPVFASRPPWRVGGLFAYGLRSDGTIVFALGADKPSMANPNNPAAYYFLMVAIDPSGHAAVEQFPAPNDRLNLGPMYELRDDYFGVLSDTANGVTIAVYRYPRAGA